MNFIKKTSVLFIVLISIFSFTKIENTKLKSKINLEELNIIKLLSDQEFQCRPSSEIMFYVDTELVKKSRGYSTINAKIYILDRFSGKTNLLANENINVLSHKESVINYDFTQSDCKKVVLANGDKTLGINNNSPYCFSDLIKYKNIYNSYTRSSNKLLKH